MNNPTFRTVELKQSKLMRSLLNVLKPPSLITSFTLGYWKMLTRWTKFLTKCEVRVNSKKLYYNNTRSWVQSVTVFLNNIFFVKLWGGTQLGSNSGLQVRRTLVLTMRTRFDSSLQKVFADTFLFNWYLFCLKDRYHKNKTKI